MKIGNFSISKWRAGNEIWNIPHRLTLKGNPPIYTWFGLVFGWEKEEGFEPVKISKFEEIVFKTLGLIFGFITLSLSLMLFYSTFFERRDLINKKKFYKYLLKNPDILGVPTKWNDVIFPSSYSWRVGIYDINSFNENEVFLCTYSAPCIMIFCSYAGDIMSKYYSKKINKLLRKNVAKYS